VQQSTGAGTAQAPDRIAAVVQRLQQERRPRLSGSRRMLADGDRQAGRIDCPLDRPCVVPRYAEPLQPPATDSSR
jgi:hypothetical protein